MLKNLFKRSNNKVNQVKEDSKPAQWEKLLDDMVNEEIRRYKAKQELDKLEFDLALDTFNRIHKMYLIDNK